MRSIRKGILGALTILSSVSAVDGADDEKAYWSQQRRGANWFNRIPTEQYIVDAKAAGIEFLRLAPDKWNAARRDFLIGDADEYRGIPSEDLAALTEALDWAMAHDVQIVLTMLSLPGSRWKQNNDDDDDLRLWTDDRYLDQAASFWRDLAGRLGDHPALIGYDILNEPHPEKLPAVDAAQAGVLVNRFNQRIVESIRAVDARTPIIVEPTSYASAETFGEIEPLDDPNVLYSFHMYEPWVYTTWRINKGRYAYPGEVEIDPWSDEDTRRRRWDEAALRAHLWPVMDWQASHAISSNRILVGEFGCSRRVPGAAEYLSDLVDLFEAQDWHWAFYSFREDNWDQMDYELGTGPAPEAYWEAIEQGEAIVPGRHDNALWDVIARRLRR